MRLGSRDSSLWDVLGTARTLLGLLCMNDKKTLFILLATHTFFLHGCEGEPSLYEGRQSLQDDAEWRPVSEFGLVKEASRQRFNMRSGMVSYDLRFSNTATTTFEGHFRIVRPCALGQERSECLPPSFQFSVRDREEGLAFDETLITNADEASIVFPGLLPVRLEPEQTVVYNVTYGPFRGRVPRVMVRYEAVPAPRVSASCLNGERDKDESGVDCGGSSSCGACEPGLSCQRNRDCLFGPCLAQTCTDICANGSCAPPVAIQKFVHASGSHMAKPAKFLVVTSNETSLSQDYVLRLSYRTSEEEDPVPFASMPLRLPPSTTSTVTAVWPHLPKVGVYEVTATTQIVVREHLDADSDTAVADVGVSDESNELKAKLNDVPVEGDPKLGLLVSQATTSVTVLPEIKKICFGAFASCLSGDDWRFFDRQRDLRVVNYGARGWSRFREEWGINESLYADGFRSPGTTAWDVYFSDAGGNCVQDPNNPSVECSSLGGHFSIEAIGFGLDDEVQGGILPISRVDFYYEVGTGSTFCEQISLDGCLGRSRASKVTSFFEEPDPWALRSPSLNREHDRLRSVQDTPPCDARMGPCKEEVYQAGSHLNSVDGNGHTSARLGNTKYRQSVLGGDPSDDGRIRLTFKIPEAPGCPDEPSCYDTAITEITFDNPEGYCRPACDQECLRDADAWALLFTSYDIKNTLGFGEHIGVGVSSPWGVSIDDRFAPVPGTEDDPVYDHPSIKSLDDIRACDETGVLQLPGTRDWLVGRYLYNHGRTVAPQPDRYGEAAHVATRLSPRREDDGFATWETTRDGMEECVKIPNGFCDSVCNNCSYVLPAPEPLFPDSCPGVPESLNDTVCQPAHLDAPPYYTDRIGIGMCTYWLQTAGAPIPVAGIEYEIPFPFTGCNTHAPMVSGGLPYPGSPPSDALQNVCKSNNVAIYPGFDAWPVYSGKWGHNSNSDANAELVAFRSCTPKDIEEGTNWNAHPVESVTACNECIDANGTTQTTGTFLSQDPCRDHSNAATRKAAFANCNGNHCDVKDDTVSAQREVTCGGYQGGPWGNFPVYGM